MLSSCQIFEFSRHFPPPRKSLKMKSTSEVWKIWKYQLCDSSDSKLNRITGTEDSHFILGAKGRLSSWSYLSRCLLWRVKQRIWLGKCWKLSQGWSFVLIILDSSSTSQNVTLHIVFNWLHLVDLITCKTTCDRWGLFRLGCLAHGFGLRARTPSRGRPPLSKLWLANCVLICWWISVTISF